MLPRIVVYPLLVALLGVAGFSIGRQLGFFGGGYPEYPDLIQFDDAPQPQEAPTASLLELSFVDMAGQPVRIGDYLGKKNLVLVFTRGYAGSICLYCSAHTSRLLAQYSEIQARDAELIVVFPVAKPADERRLTEFLDRVRKELDRPPDRVPFPLTLDTGLVAVDRLGIRHNLSKPATFVLDRQGKVRFSYVGATLADRPSVKAILDQLDALRDTP